MVSFSVHLPQLYPYRFPLEQRAGLFILEVPFIHFL